MWSSSHLPIALHLANRAPVVSVSPPAAFVSNPVVHVACLALNVLAIVTYSTTRFGVYEHLKTLLPPSPSNKPPSTPTLVLLASASGLLGGIAGNPADVLNVRMQHDASLPEAQRLNYKSAVHGLVRMVREEGPGSLFRGVWPNALRASLMTASQLASYDVFKDLLVSRLGMGEENLKTHFSASLMAGFVATTVCSPVDVIKTRIMSQKKADGDKKGSGGGGIRTVLVDLWKKEGPMWMWRGWLPSFVRLGPHTIATFLFLEQHKKLYRKWKGTE